MKLKIIVAALILLFVASCQKKEEIRTGVTIDGNKSYAASVYRQNCAICHGTEGNGKTINGKIVPSLRSQAAVAKTEAEVYNQIANGKLPMPPFKDQLTETELRTMTRFIMRDLQGRK